MIIWLWLLVEDPRVVFTSSRGLFSMLSFVHVSENDDIFKSILALSVDWRLVAVCVDRGNLFLIKFH